MSTASLLERLNAERKSLETQITEDSGSIFYLYPRKGWQRISRMEASRPLEDHLKTLAWVEAHEG